MLLLLVVTFLAYRPAWHGERLWVDDTLGYHLVNISLHLATALLLFAILRTLQVKGALLASAVFALHPVHVESVAWITELKNTLAGVLFAATVLAWLRFDATGWKRAARLTAYHDPQVLDVLAAAYAETGRFGDAVSIATTALDLARDAGLAPLAGEVEGRLGLYRSGQPFHE